jgi:hypothetical protein
MIENGVFFFVGQFFDEIFFVLLIENGVFCWLILW